MKANRKKDEAGTRSVVAQLTTRQKKEFHSHGFLVLENVIPPPVLAALRRECEAILATVPAHSIPSHGCIFEAMNVTSRSQLEEDEIQYREKLDAYKNKRKRRVTHLCPKLSEQTGECITDFMFGELIHSILNSLLGEPMCLFNEQYIVKMPHAGASSRFVYHQDVEYVERDRAELPPYVSVWCSLDEVDEENGTLYMIPFPQTREGTIEEKESFSSPEELRAHHLMKAAAYPGRFGSEYTQEQNEGGEKQNQRDEDLWNEEEDEIPILMPPGSICIISSLVVHRSGGNISDRKRRIFMPQYSWGPITRRDGSLLVFGVPLPSDNRSTFGCKE